MQYDYIILYDIFTSDLYFFFFFISLEIGVVYRRLYLRVRVLNRFAFNSQDQRVRGTAVPKYRFTRTPAGTAAGQKESIQCQRLMKAIYTLPV